MKRLLHLHAFFTLLITDWYLKPYYNTTGSTHSKTVTSDSVIYTSQKKQTELNKNFPHQV